MKARYPDRIGRYEVIDRLGVGGMGAVYLASDPLLGRTVAVKILHTDDDELRQRFEREARSAASLRHQHIVTIYDIGDDEGGPFLAMEFLDGETMAEVIRRRSPLAIDARLELMSQLCSGLGYAHRKGIIHRDIKPANLMITSEGVLKIVDFGLARVTSGASMTRSGMLMGTPHYMSPEQIQGNAVDHLSDIFSVGVVLYELISYRKAYSGDSTAAILHNILHGEPAPITASVGELDPELEVVVSRAIERPKERRYQDLRELGADLDRVRTRLKAISEGATVVVDRSAVEFSARPKSPEAEDTKAPPSVNPPPSDAGRTPSTPRRNLDAITHKRAAQIAQHLAAASGNVDAGRLEAAVEECEHALLLDPHDERALELLEQAHEAIDDRQVRRWVDEARAEMSHGAFTRAEGLVEQALKLRSQSSGARALQQEIRETRREHERAADRARAANAAVERARRSLQDGAIEAAARAVSEALGYDSAHKEALALRAAAAAALEEQRREQALNRAAHEAAERARQQADGGNHSEALAALRAFVPPHPVVNDAIAEIEARVRALEQERREEEERARQRALEEARRQEQLATLRREATTAIERSDWNRARAAARAARESAPGDEELEQLCRDIETEANAAEAAARVRASAQRHLQVAEAALARGDLPAAAKSAAAAARLTPEDAEVLRLQQAVKEELARAEAARQLLLREQMERERLEHERVERERLEREQLERERLERERVERERLEQERLLHERQAQERLEQERLEAARVRALEEARRHEQLATLRRDARVAIKRGDWAAARATVRAARDSLAGDAELEQLCHEIETETNVAEVAASLRAAAQGHLRAAEAALTRGDLPAAVKSVDAAASLTPDDAEVLRLQNVLKDQMARVARERVEHERLERDRLEQERLLHERKEQERLEQERLEAERLARVRALEEERLKEEERARQRARAAARRQEQLVALQRTAQAAIDRGDWKGSRAAVRAARKSLAGDEELERVCRAIEADTNAAETAARSRASAQRHLRAAEAALARGDLAAAAKSAAAAAGLTPEDSEILQLQQVVTDQLARAEAARQLLLREQIERERLERDRVERERLERERVERERLERERVERERLEQERLLQERQEQERLKHERLEAARLARERQDQERLEREERRSRERQERERSAEKHREADVHAALARDRQLAAESRVRAEALQSSAEEERRVLELRSTDAPVQQPDSPPSEAETPPVLDQPATQDEAPAAVTTAKPVIAIQPVVAVTPGVRVARAEPRRSRLFVAGAIAAAAVVVLAIGIFRPREPVTENQQQQAPPPPPAVDYSAILQQGLDAYQRGEVAAAIRTALSIPESAGERQRALEFLQTIRSDAAAQAQAERRAAETTGKAGDAAFLEAVTKQQEAERVTSPADSDRAVSLLAEASRLYRQAAETGLSTMDLLETARRELQANRIPGAIEYALRALTLAPGDENAVAFLRSVRTQAERQAQTAAVAARRAGASADNSPAFKDAVAHENIARAVTDVKETQRAYDEFSKARDQYAVAGTQLREATQREAQRFRAAVERVEQRLKANDIAGAAAALQDVEQLNPTDPAIEGLRKRLADLRANASNTEANTRRDAQVRQILDAADRETNDNAALKVLQSALTQFPGEPRIEAALTARRRSRDNTIADFVRRARGASGPEAVQLLEQALALDPSRSDIRTERDNRRRGPNTTQIERDVRNTIEKFKDAYESRNVGDVLRVAPNMSRSFLENEFKSYSRIRLDIEPYTVAQAPDGTSAGVTCVIRVTRTPAGISARPLDDRRTRQFQLRNVDGTWLITGAQF